LRRKVTERGQSAEALRQDGLIVGTINQVVDQLGEYQEKGAQRIMLQWMALDDIDGLEALAHGVLTQ